MKQTRYFLCALVIFWANLAFALSLDQMKAIISQDASAIVAQNIPVKLFFSNPRAFQEVITIFRDAKPGETVFTETFEFHNDSAGRIFALEAIEAARRGVLVPCIIDGWSLHKWWRLNSEKRRKEDISPLLYAMVKEGVPVYIYNSRKLPAKGFKNNLRNHRKLTMRMNLDGTAVAFNGGRNIGDLYFTENDGAKTAVDVSARVRIQDPQVAQRIYEMEYLSLLQSRYLEPVTVPKNLSRKEHEAFLTALRQQVKKDLAVLDSQMEGALDFSEVQVEYAAYLQHEHHTPSFLTVLNALLSQTEYRAMLASAYVLPQDEQIQQLLAILDQKREVAIYTNSDTSTHHSFLIRLMREYLQNLLNHGLTLHLRHEGELHAKVGAIDESVAIVGSANLNARSWFSDLENGWFFYSPALAKQIEQFFKAQAADGQYYQPSAEDRKLGFGHACYMLGLKPIKRFF